MSDHPSSDHQPVVGELPRDGLVDIHCHGALGHAFGDTAQGSRTAAAHLLSQGIVGIVASLVSASPRRLADQVAILAPLVADGTLRGIHLEGPFLSPERKGAHDPTLLRHPDPALVEDLVEVAAAHGAPAAIRHLTFAPELPGAEALIRSLAAHRIIPAIGHTAASADQVRTSIDLITEATGRPALITHLFNGMPPFHHRSGGPVAAALSAAARGEAFVELITDGVHVAADVVRMVFDTVGAHRVVLVSDATAATGLGDGDYVLGTLPVRVDAGTARIVLADGSAGSIAGSTSTLADCVRWAVEVAALAPSQVRAAATSTPRSVLAPWDQDGAQTPAS